MMLVKQTRVIFEVKDVLAIRVECKNCANEIALRLNSDKSIPDDCPMCRCSQWIVGTYADRLIKTLRDAYGADPKVRTIIRFEIDGEEA